MRVSSVHIDNVSSGKRTDYVSAGKMTIARVINNAPTYVHHDNVGSPVSGTNSSGSIAWRERYTPFGITLDNASANNDQAGYTGHIKDGDTGLVYMQARYYDPVIGRFYSNDPIGYIADNPVMSFNRYLYVNNNPYKYTDPSGQILETVWDVASFSVGVTSLGNNLSQGNWGAAALDALGVVADGAAIALPGVPGGAGMAMSGARNGSNVIQGHHGTKMANVDSIKADGALKPNSHGEIFLSQNQADTFMHGVDSSIGGAVSANVSVDVSAATSVTNVSVPGNPNAILIKTDTPLPTTVNSVTVRTPKGDGGFKLEDQ